MEVTINIELTETEEKILKNELKFDKNFITNMIKEKIKDIKEKEKISSREEKIILKRLKKAKIEEGISVEEFLRDYLEEKELYKKGVERYNKYLEDSTTYTHEEIKKELEL